MCTQPTALPCSPQRWQHGMLHPCCSCVTASKLPVAALLPIKFDGSDSNALAIVALQNAAPASAPVMYSSARASKQAGAP
mmetsp:Transcript_17553/g.26525  ORF Transcript_17553/g.26525 Transcript_17553/m.26525 type:complete len:80 (-) Transcript_17553:91-330(-)